MLRSLALAGVVAVAAAGCSTSSTQQGRYGSRYPDVRSYPASAKTTEGGQERYTICHNGRQTLTLPTAAVDAHLRHGDRFGACSSRGRDDRGRGRSGQGRGQGR